MTPPPATPDLLTRRPRLAGLGLAAVVALSSGCVDPDFIKDRYVEAFRMASASMAPTLLAGDWVLVNKVVYRRRDPARGELVVFAYPLDERRSFIKRIVATGGDVVYVEGRRVYLGCRPPEPDCRPVEEPWAASGGGASPGRFGPVRVPPAAYFVLGDDRDNSQDSRYWGFIQRDKIQGKVFFIYWSWDAAEKRVRWERLGWLSS